MNKLKTLELARINLKAMLKALIAAGVLGNLIDYDIPGVIVAIETERRKLYTELPDDG